MFDRGIYIEKLHYPWSCRENSTNQRVTASKLHQKNLQGSHTPMKHLKWYRVGLNNQKLWLYGIVVLFLTESVKYTVLYLNLFVRFSNIVLLQIKVCNVGLWLITLYIYINASQTITAEKEAIMHSLVVWASMDLYFHKNMVIKIYIMTFCQFVCELFVKTLLVVSLNSMGLFT